MAQRSTGSKKRGGKQRGARSASTKAETAGKTAEPASPADQADARPVDHDAERMLAFQRGDMASFEELVRNNQGKVFSIVMRFVHNEATAEDLVQEVFIRVFRTAARYEPRARFSTWLYRVAVNVSLNALRSRAKLQTVSLDVVSETTGEEFHRSLADPAIALPHEMLGSDELEVRIVEALDAIPEKQRAAVVLSRYERLRYDEISRVLGCSVMAVKSLLSRARCNLRDHLAKYLDIPD